jgi:phosphoribosylanthranilate isomerase
MTRVKICGITNAADRDAAVDAGAHALGFIVDVGVDTPREIDRHRAAALVDGVPPFVTTVLVTMADAVQPAAHLQRHIDADAIQIHRGLAPDYVGGLGERTDARVIAVVDPDADDVHAYADAADALLVDTPTESGGGGTGRTHDWERTATLVESVDAPVILAGGLTPENVADAVERVGPYGVDTASGVEARGGEKDHDAVGAFVRNATGGVSA